MVVRTTTTIESEVTDRCLIWDDTEPICWSNNPYTWDDVCLVIELVTG